MAKFKVNDIIVPKNNNNTIDIKQQIITVGEYQYFMKSLNNGWEYASLIDRIDDEYILKPKTKKVWIVVVWDRDRFFKTYTYSEKPLPFAKERIEVNGHRVLDIIEKEYEI
jgi:hypothetical protein